MCYLSRLRANIANTLIPSVHPSPRQECVCVGFCFVPTKGERGENAGWWRQKKSCGFIVVSSHSCRKARWLMLPQYGPLGMEGIVRVLDPQMWSTCKGLEGYSVLRVVLFSEDLRLNIYRVRPNGSRVAISFFFRSFPRSKSIDGGASKVGKSRRQGTRVEAVEAAMDTYDALVFPGFLRQPPAKWQDDGSCAPSGRARGKADQFALSLPRPSIEADIAAIEHESSNGQRAKRRGSKS